MKIIELRKKYAVKRCTNCSICGKYTTWYHIDSYYHKKEDKPLCKECKLKIKRKGKLPKHHR